MNTMMKVMNLKQPSIVILQESVQRISEFQLVFKNSKNLYATTVFNRDVFVKMGFLKMLFLYPLYFQKILNCGNKNIIIIKCGDISFISFQSAPYSKYGNILK